jgi:dihydrofolate synthase/folylpolyglutamate synthase
VTLRDRLAALEHFGIKLGLDSMHTLVDVLQYPERAYHTVHVAGTNGKGSVCAMVSAGLRASGYRTGVYTSPHLDRIEERIAVDGSPITAEAFDAALSEVFGAVDALQSSGRLGVTPTFFEVITATAFVAFRQAGVSIAVIEVGLGGRMDATNVITPVATAVTSIAFDHERHLGSTLASIAFEKAGITKRGVPMIMGQLPDEAGVVVEAQAQVAQAPLIHADEYAEVVRYEQGTCVVRCTSWGASGELRLSLAGRHQGTNAATAVALLRTIDASGVPVPPHAVAHGLTQATWPGRLEWITVDRGRLLVDAAHNPSGAEALARYLADIGMAPMPMALVVMEDKVLEGIVRPLGPHVSHWWCTQVPMARSRSHDGLARSLQALFPGTPVSAVPDPLEAIQSALRERGCAMAAGSIYFIGPARARLLAGGGASF